MTSPAIDALCGLSENDIERVIARMDGDAVHDIVRDFTEWAQDGQREPPGDWDRWVIMAGRGFGKTRAGAEWIAARAAAQPGARIALVAATFEEARDIMVEGESGLLAVAAEDIVDWVPSRKLLRFKSGAEAMLFSGASPEKLRGPQHHFAWCDELAKWRHPRATWDMLQLGLRLGGRPRALITTTPQSGRALEDLITLPGTAQSGGATRENIHLSKAFLDSVHTLYRGTRLEAQELEGQLLPASNFALWSPELIERCRVNSPHPWGGFQKIVIGVDPPSGDGTCGIVACGKDAKGIGHVLADHSVTGRSPEGWARAVSDAVRVYEEQSDLPVAVIAERNQGGKMVEAVLIAADSSLKVTLVNASEGKAARAAPVAALFEGGRAKFAGRFAELEAELRGFRNGSGYDPGGWIGRGAASASPDRADAMVWALTALILVKPRPEPRVWRL